MFTLLALLPTVLTLITCAILIPILVWAHCLRAEAPIEAGDYGDWTALEAELSASPTVYRAKRNELPRRIHTAILRGTYDAIVHDVPSHGMILLPTYETWHPP